MLLRNSLHIFKLKSISLTILLSPNFSKRFTGGGAKNTGQAVVNNMKKGLEGTKPFNSAFTKKPYGHAHNILNKVNKNPQTLQPNTSQKHTEVKHTNDKYFSKLKPTTTTPENSSQIDKDTWFNSNDTESSSKAQFNLHRVATMPVNNLNNNGESINPDILLISPVNPIINQPLQHNTEFPLPSLPNIDSISTSNLLDKPTREQIFTKIQEEYHKVKGTEQEKEYFQKKKKDFSDRIEKTKVTQNKKELKELYKELKNFCQCIIDNNITTAKIDYRNDYITNLINNKYSNEPWAQIVYDHFKTSIKKVPVKPDDFAANLNILHHGKNILDQFGNDLPEVVLMELFRQHNVLKNNDAQYLKDDNKTSIVQLFGEGFTFHDRVYDLFSLKKHDYFEQYRTELFTKNEMQQIEDNILKGNFFIRKTNLNPDKIKDFYANIPLASGDLIHCMICVDVFDALGNKFEIAFNSLTSTKDSGTVSLGCKQMTNFSEKQQNKDQQLKEQYCRPFNQAIYIPENENWHKDEIFTEFITNTNYNNSGLNLKEKIFDLFKTKKALLQETPIRMIQKITLSALQKISNDLITQDIINLNEDYKKLNDELKSLTADQKEKFLNKRENALKNMFQAQQNKICTKTLPDFFQDIMKMKTKLELTLKLNEK